MFIVPTLSTRTAACKFCMPLFLNADSSSVDAERDDFSEGHPKTLE